MIELDLVKLRLVVVAHLKTLAAVRCLCLAHEIPVGWCAEAEREAAGSLRELRKVIAVKGDVLVMKPKG